MTNLYIDCEWFSNQKMFLIGYAYSLNESGQLYDWTLKKQNFIKVLKKVDGFIFFYGPDIGMLEKYFSMDIRHKYRCINLLPVFKKHYPGLESYRLCELEKHFNLVRSSAQYKKNIRTLIKDWFIPSRKKNALKYNTEDVLNLIRVKNKVFSFAKVTPQKLLPHIMK